MTEFLFRNNASALLTVELAAGGVLANLGVGAGAVFPNPSTGQGFLVTAQNGSDIEIMLVTSRAGDVLTVQRAQEGTAARIWPVGTPIEMRVTAGLMAQFFQLGKNVTSFIRTLAMGTEGKITGGTIESTKLNGSQINDPDLRTALVRPLDGSTGSAIVMPNTDGRPTIAGSRIVTEAGANFDGPITVVGDAKAVTGTFGALHFTTGAEEHATVSVSLTDALTSYNGDVDIRWMSDSVERFRYDKTTKNFGFGVVAPLQVLHARKGGATPADMFTRLENNANQFDVGVDLNGKGWIKMLNSFAFALSIAGAERIGIDTTGRMTQVTAFGNGNGHGIRFISTSDPSGGADGDLWFKV